MTLKVVLASASLVFLTPFAFAETPLTANSAKPSAAVETGVNGGSQVQVQLYHEPMHGGGYYWQCSAHSTHNEYQVYYGDVSSSRYEAADTAVHECEHHEMHPCALHECHITR